MRGYTESWRVGQVERVDDAAHGIRRIVISTDHAIRAEPGSHLDVRIGADRIRSYSIVECANGGSTFTLGVHLSATSRGGSRYMHSLQSGDEIQINGPLQNFPLRIGAQKYVLLAGGIGITALVAMAATLARQGADYTLIYLGRRREVMAFLPELTAAHGERLRLQIDDEGTPVDVKTLVSELADCDDAHDTELYMCGPISLMDAVQQAWRNEHLPAANLRYETFGNSGRYPSEEFVVRIPRLGAETTVRRNESVLDALERSGVEVMYDCRKGECGLCRVNVIDLDGEIDHRDVFLDEEQKCESRRMCVCVSRVVRRSSSLPIGVLTLDLP
ncbi:PDR/VanB family oxidoreductase [Rhodococcus sp. NPDC055024]